MYILEYGNKYAKNKEKYYGNNMNDQIILGMTLDFLDTQEDDYRDISGNLPKDWCKTIFWNYTKSV